MYALESGIFLTLLNPSTVKNLSPSPISEDIQMISVTQSTGSISSVEQLFLNRDRSLDIIGTEPVSHQESIAGPLPEPDFHASSVINSRSVTQSLGSISSTLGATGQSSYSTQVPSTAMDIVVSAKSALLETIPKRRPGRPKGSRNSTTAEKNLINQEKRPVGRPRGTGAKQIQAAETQARLEARREEIQLKKSQSVCVLLF